MDKQAVREALKQVRYPGFSRDIVSFGIVQEIEAEGGEVYVRLTVTSADPTVPKQLRDNTEACLRALEGVKAVRVEVTVQPPKATPAVGNPQESRPPSLAHVRRIIAIASGKGGVGKSTFSVNLACALDQELSARGAHDGVGILDCDIYGPSIPQMLGLAERPEVRNEKLLPPENFGVRAISMGLLVDEDAPVVWRGPMVNTAIQQFVKHVDWGRLAILVVDLPPGTGDAQLSLVQTVPLDGAVIVTTPQKVAVDVARRGARMFGKVGVPILGVAENMSYLAAADGARQYLFGQGGGGQVAADLDTVLLGQVPLDPHIREGGDRGIPVVKGDPGSPAAQEFRKIARSLLDRLQPGA